jgi:hypothetical protein
LMIRPATTRRPVTRTKTAMPRNGKSVTFSWRTIWVKLFHSKFSDEQVALWIKVIFSWILGSVEWKFTSECCKISSTQCGHIKGWYAITCHCIICLSGTGSRQQDHVT